MHKASEKRLNRSLNQRHSKSKTFSHQQRASRVRKGSTRSIISSKASLQSNSAKPAGAPSSQVLHDFTKFVTDPRKLSGYQREKPVSMLPQPREVSRRHRALVD